MSDCITSVLKADSLDGNCQKGWNKGKPHKFEQTSYKVWICKYCKVVRYT